MPATQKSRQQIMIPDKSPYRWTILFLVWLLYLSHGLVARSASPLVTPILKDLDMSYGQMGFVLGSWQLTYLVVAMLAGFVLDRWGARKSLFLGSIIVSLSATLRYFAQSFSSLLFMVALFGVGGSLISIGAPKVISLWFSGKDRGIVVGIYSTGPRIGQMFVLGATNGIVMPLTGHSWRLTFYYMECLPLERLFFGGIFQRMPVQQKVLNTLTSTRLLGGFLKYTMSVSYCWPVCLLWPFHTVL